MARKKFRELIPDRFLISSRRFDSYLENISLTWKYGFSQMLKFLNNISLFLIFLSWYAQFILLFSEGLTRIRIRRKTRLRRVLPPPTSFPVSCRVAATRAPVLRPTVTPAPVLGIRNPEPAESHPKVSNTIQLFSFNYLHLYFEHWKLFLIWLLKHCSFIFSW